MNKPTTDQDRRKHHRIMFDTLSTLHINTEVMQTHVIDISLKGILIKRPTGWTADVGNKGQLDITLNDNSTMIKMDVEVVRIEDDHVGFRCKDIDIDSITHLRRLVELNLDDPLLLEREFNALEK